MAQWQLNMRRGKNKKEMIETIKLDYDPQYPRS